VRIPHAAFMAKGKELSLLVLSVGKEKRLADPHHNVRMSKGRKRKARHSVGKKGREETRPLGVFFDFCE